MKYVTRKQIGLKPLPVTGGGNIGAVDGGVHVTPIDSGWTKVRIDDGPMAGNQGWAHTADIVPDTVAIQPVALGIYTLNKTTDNWQDDFASGQKALTQVVPGIIHRYQPWQGAAWSPWDNAWVNDAVSLGSMPMISWEGRDINNKSPLQPAYSNAAVAAGTLDAVILPFLKAAGAWGKPFMLRFLWEGNGQWYPWGAGTNSNTPTTYIAAYRHIASLVRQYAPKAMMVWCVGTSGSGWLPLEAVYPGDDVVDFLSCDFYNTGTVPGGWSGAWVPFSAVQPWYDRLVQLAPTKPIVIAETGCTMQAGQDKAAWYAAIPAACITMPNLKGIVAFDNTDNTQDFRVSADPAVYTVWKALAGNPLMQGRIVPTSPPIVVTGPIVPFNIPGTWKQTFGDEFDGATLDLAKWGPNWLGAPGAITPPVNGEEIAAYDPAQVSLADGELRLTAIANPVSVNGKSYPLRSGMIQSNGKYNFSYGCVEARMQLPAGVKDQSVWPALWTTGQPPWPANGEIDVLEAYGTDLSCSPHYHSLAGAPGKDNVLVVGATSAMHTYAMTWEPGLIVWYYDGQEVYRTTTDVVSSPHFLILNLGMKGTQTLLPAVMRVEYVRVWQKG